MILFCACAYSDVIPAATKAEALAAAGAGGVRIVPDLCGCAARRDPILSESAAADDLTIVACHPRAVRALFAWAGTPLDATRVRFINLREKPAESTELRPPVEVSPTALPVVDRTAEWIPWFPVIDTARCTGCRQCLEFCLFGVYETDEHGAVMVTHPEGCKTNCPACARLCPNAAIIFPKYTGPPINGEEITDEAAVRAASRELAEGDLRAALEERRRKRRALLKPEYRPGPAPGEDS